jgi:hypothetical protein
VESDDNGEAGLTAEVWGENPRLRSPVRMHFEYGRALCGNTFGNDGGHAGALDGNTVTGRVNEQHISKAEKGCKNP